MELPGQKFALVSFIHHDGKAAMRVLGTFPDEESANAHCKRLMDLDNRFDIFMTSMYNWVPCAPSREEVQEEKWSDQYIQEMMTGYEQAQADAHKEFEERKMEMLAKQDEENKQRREDNKKEDAVTA